jgi:hypothetical protein
MPTALPEVLAGKRAALVVAHPGHELRVHGWLELARPRAFVLTDGSGHGERGRLASTSTVLARAGARPGAIYGRMSDRDAYELILGRAAGPLIDLADGLAASLVGEGIDYVVGDSMEGFNPVHDLCSVLAGAAVAVAERRLGRGLGWFDFPLDGSPEGPAGDPVPGVFLELDEAALARKLAAARAYPEMAGEVEAALGSWGAAAFRRERLSPVARDRPPAARVAEPPSYEAHGERQVAAGYYRQVLRFRAHFLPLAEELGAWAAGAW